MSVAFQDTAAGWDRRCFSKRGFRTEVRARMAAFIQLRIGTKVPALYVYPCDVCGEWHLTKRPNGSSPVTNTDFFGREAKKNPAVTSGGIKARKRAQQKETKDMPTLLAKQPARTAAPSRVPPPQQRITPVQQMERWLDRGRSEVFTVQTALTPATAQMLLDRNPDNRHVQERAALRSVAAYAGMMTRGEWCLNGETMIVSREGLLNDGQHRALACIQANIDVPVSITFGVERETRKTVDQGKARSNGDVLALAGEVDVNRLAAALRFVWITTRRFPFSECPTPDQLLAELDRHPGLREAIRKASALTKLKVGAFSAGAYYLCHQHSPVHADVFLDRVATGLNISHRNNPEAQLRRRYEEHARGTKSGHIDGVEQAALFIKAFNAYIHRRNIRQLSWKASTEAFPKVGE